MWVVFIQEKNLSRLYDACTFPLSFKSSLGYFKSFNFLICVVLGDLPERLVPVQLFAAIQGKDSI